MAVPKPLGIQISEYLKSRKVVGVDRYVPYFLSSLGCHIASLYNNGFEEICETFWTQLGQSVDCRLHLMLVGPPGYGKNFAMDNFIREDIGLAHGLVPGTFVNKITDKSFFGGWGDEGQWMPGLAEDYRTGIIGIHELSSVLTMGKAEHSSAMLDQLLEALSGGEVTIRTGGREEHKYRTHFTMWAGIQGERFNVPSGFNRRVCILNLSPNLEEIAEYSRAHYEGQNIPPDYDTIRRIREQFILLHHEFGNYLDRIVFDKDYTKYLQEEKKLPHPDLELLDRVAVGWTIMYKPLPSGTLHIYLDKSLKKLLLDTLDMKHRTLLGVTASQIIKILPKDPITLTDLKRQCIGLGIESQKASTAINELAIHQFISYYPFKERGKPTVTMVQRGPNWSADGITE